MYTGYGIIRTTEESEKSEKILIFQFSIFFLKIKLLLLHNLPFPFAIASVFPTTKLRYRKVCY